MKGFLKRLVAFCVVLCLFLPITEAFAAGVKGDINSDGKLKLSDVRRILRMASSMEETGENLKVADMNGDGKVTLADVNSALYKAIDIDIKSSLKKAPQITPKEKHYSTKTMRFCEVMEYCAETLPTTPVTDKSNPLYTPLPKGTFDYIKSGPVKDSVSGNEYYVLNSNRRVYANEIEVFTGHGMPYNKAHLRTPIAYEEDSTKFYVALDWRVPFNVTIKPEEYEKGYDSREFNVVNGDFSGTYMDIYFYYTNVAEGSLNFPESETIKSCRWFVNKETNSSILRIYFREAGGFYGYKVGYNKNNLLVISIKEPVKKLSGRTIEIDPGHGGAQPGAGSGTGVYESDITYNIALQLKEYLENAGARVIFSRDNSASVPEIEERRINSMKRDADMLISIHLDASDSKSTHGSSVYYYKSYSAPLAKAISENLPKTLKNDVGYPMTDRGFHFYPFKVTRIENCPAVLVECGFISNTWAVVSPSPNALSQAKSDFQLLNSSLGQKYVAKGIYQGIVEYFNI